MKKDNEKIGDVAHYFTDIEVAIIDLMDDLKLGDKIRVVGATTDFEQDVTSMQIEHEEVDKAASGDSIGLKVKKRVREGDEVYKIT
ncbi:translation elongation factor-like protein [Candidatus Bathyarchaeota archaeon]|nr:translation elongation factor-like protein [Candidatus Bathyarchaeota archaeon]